MGSCERNKEWNSADVAPKRRRQMRVRIIRRDPSQGKSGEERYEGAGVEVGQACVGRSNPFGLGLSEVGQVCLRPKGDTPLVKGRRGAAKRLEDALELRLVAGAQTAQALAVAPTMRCSLGWGRDPQLRNQPGQVALNLPKECGPEPGVGITRSASQNCSSPLTAWGSFRNVTHCSHTAGWVTK